MREPGETKKSHTQNSQERGCETSRARLPPCAQIRAHCYCYHLVFLLPQAYELLHALDGVELVLERGRRAHPEAQGARDRQGVGQPKAHLWGGNEGQPA